MAFDIRLLCLLPLAMFSPCGTESARAAMLPLLAPLSLSQSLSQSPPQGPTRAQEFEARFRAAKTAEEFFQLGQWAIEKKLKSEAKKAMKRALELDPRHAGANQYFGKVEYKGEWLDPAERDARVAKDLEAEMLAKGLVRWKDSWVTVEEHSHLSKGEVLYEGKWIPFEDAQRRKGLELFEGDWLARPEALARQTAFDIEKLLARPLQEVLGTDALLAGDVDEAALKAISAGLDKGRLWFDGVMNAPKGLELFGGRRAVFFVWKADEPYLGSITPIGALTNTIPPGWAEAVAKSYGFVWWDPYPMSSARSWKRGPKDLEGHCYHHWGHLLANRLGYDGRLLPPWYEEGLAALMEHRAHGVNLVFCRGELIEKPIAGNPTGDSGKGKRHETKVAKKTAPPVALDGKGVNDGKWREGLKGALAEIPPFDEIAQRAFNELSLSDIAASMAIVEWLESRGEGALRRFHDELKKGAPPPPNRVLPNELLREAYYNTAFQAAVKLNWQEADKAWREWFRTR